MNNVHFENMEFNKARVVSYSKMVDCSGNELSLLEQVAYCARVSNPENQNNHETSEKLCKYLLKNHHYSPFEMANICVEIETTRDISRQMLRHRSFSFQEFSQRYSEVNDYTTRECRKQHPKNRQMSVLLDVHNSELDAIEFENFKKMQLELIQKQKQYYNYCILNNIAKEQSRVFLSEGLTKTKLYMNGTLRSWIHYIQLRSDTNTTQREHCDISLKIAKEIQKIFPLDLFSTVKNVS
jgi:thymidylate synthase (FAD)